MVVNIQNLFGFAQLETVNIVKVDKREVDSKLALVIVSRTESGKQVKFGVLEPALESFAQHTEQVEPGKYRSQVPSEFISDSRKMRWINIPY